MSAHDGPEITPILRWLGMCAGALALASALLAGFVGYRLMETQQRLDRLVQDCGACCDQDVPQGVAPGPGERRI